MKQSTMQSKTKGGKIPFQVSTKHGLWSTRSSLLLLLFAILVFSSCEEKEEMDKKKPTQNFTVTIENVFEPKMYYATGLTEGIAPGGMFTFSFDAGKGHYLSFATMLAQSNDLFYGFADMGLPLYNMHGMPVTGDVTQQMYLWDAGTEVNEEPGVGPNQAPRQNAPNTGLEENGNVIKIMDAMDGFMYPSVMDMIKVTLEHDGGTMFTVTIKNMSDMATLPSPFAPGVWAVHGSGVMLYTEGMPASNGLEHMAEDGNNMVLGDYLMMNTGLVSPFAPGVYAIYQGLNPVFKDNKEASDALEALAEDGDPSLFNFDDMGNVEYWAAFTTPTTGSAPAPLFPAESYEFSFTASQGDVLSFATMLVQSNDLFIAPEGISLFMNGEPISGDVTMYLKLWDAKTELNEAPGAGMNQAPRQAGPDTGTDETGNVEIVNDRFTYPNVMDMIKVTITLN